MIMMLLSAIMMTSCDIINDMITANAPAAEPFPEPITRTPQEIRESGITAEDVLAEYDRLVWDMQIKSYQHICKDEFSDDWEQVFKEHEDEITAQFVKLTPRLDHNDIPYPMYGMPISKGFVNELFFLPEEDRNKVFNDVYPLTLFYNEVLAGEPNENPMAFRAGAHKDQFQPFGDLMICEKFILTEDSIAQLSDFSPINSKSENSEEAN